MSIYAVFGTIILGFILLLCFLGHYLFRNLRIFGFGFLRLAGFIYVQTREIPVFYYNELKLDGELNLLLEKFIRTTNFSLCLLDMQLSWDRVAWKLVLNFGSLNLFFSPPITNESAPSNNDKSRPLTTSIRLALFFGHLLLRLSKTIWTIRVGKVNIAFTHFPKPIKADIWNVLQISVENLCIFEGAKLGLSHDKVLGREIIFNKEGLILVDRAIVRTSGLQFCHENADWSLSVDGLHVDLWPTTLLLLTGAAITPDEISVGPAGEASPTVELKNINHLIGILVSHRQLLTMLIPMVSVRIHLPLSKVEMERFESFDVIVMDFRAFASIAPQQPLLVAACCKEAVVLSTATDKFGVTVRSTMQKLFEDALGSLQSQKERFLIFRELTLSNCLPLLAKNELKPIELSMIKEWIKLVSTGRPVWSVQETTTSNDDHAHELPSSPNSNFPHFYERITTNDGHHPFQQTDFTVLSKGTIFARMKDLSFDVPFEYPLSNLFDHLTYFVKIVQSPKPKKSDRQEFDLFNKTWSLIVQADQVAFNITDSPFESRLAKCFWMKSLLYNKLSRMEKIFWQIIHENQAKLSENCGDGLEEIWMNPTLTALAKSSEHPELLSKNPYWAKRYARLQSSLFDLYKAHIHEEVGSIKPLFHLGAKDANLFIQWDDSFVDSMAHLLNAIEGDEFFTDEQVKEFGLFLGGFVDVSVCNLKITLRDYVVPLCHTQKGRLLGLLFLVEEPSYPNAKSLNRVMVEKTMMKEENMPGSRNHWNLIGLDEQCRALIQKTILPTKIYHSVHLALSGEEPVLSGFSPLFEGTFQMLDRAFELFTKPSEELSPSLPFWDKLRLLLRGSSSSLRVISPCRVVCLAGTNLSNDEEAITVLFPKGLTLGLDGANVRLRISEAIASLNSEKESLLRWLHRTTGENFFKADYKLLDGACQNDIPIIAFPSLDFTVSFEYYGIDGRKVISHNSLRICAASAANSPKGVGYDSYRLFRIHRLMMNIRILTGISERSKFLLFYYRELEQWFARGFARFVTPPVERGVLFQVGNLTKTATPKLSSVLTDVQLQLSYDGFFCVRGLQYYDRSDLGGALLSSNGRTRINLAWRLSDCKSFNPNYGTWFLHFAEYDFSNMRLSIIAKPQLQGKEEDKTTTAASLQSKGFPIAFENTAIYDVLITPRLFYIVINEGCFKNDADAAAIQRKTIQRHLDILGADIEEMTIKLKLCDPQEDMNKFSQIKKGLSVLLEQSEYISKFMRPDENRASVSNHHVIIQNARLLWHQKVRDAVFSLVDQQFQFSRCCNATAYKSIRSLERQPIGRHGRKESAIAFEMMRRRTSSPMSASSPTAAEALFEQLMGRGSPLEVQHEDLSQKKEGDADFKELLVDPYLLHGHDDACISLRLDVYFVHPQIILLDTTLDNTTDSAIVVTAQSAGLKYGTIVQSEFGELVGRRTKIVLEDALFHGAFQRDSPSWPPVYPVEYLLSKETEESKFKRMSEKFRVTFVYDVSNERISYQSYGTMVKKLFGQGDRLRVDVGAVNLLTTSELYAALYDVIVRLLVYRDPAQKVRSEQLESLMFATNIFNQAEITKTMYEMHDAFLMKKKYIEGKLQRSLHYGSVENVELKKEYEKLKAPWDELALVVDAMHTVLANRERFKQKQRRLTLDVLIRKIQWTLLQTTSVVLCDFSLTDIHDCWLSAEDGCQSNLLEIRVIRAQNKLPDAFYKTLIAPVPKDVQALMHSEMGFRGIGTQGNSLRFFFKARPPVGGIIILEHVELNLAPLQVQLTYDIAEEIFKYFFPERPTVEADQSDRREDLILLDEDETILLELKDEIKSTATSFLSRFGDRLDNHDVALMKARAAENFSFVYITVPASQHLISFKGKGDSSFTDVDNFILRLPDFEYHSQIISWLEFFLKLRRDSISVLLSNAGALVKDKIKKLGQANVSEQENAERPLSSRLSGIFNSKQSTIESETGTAEEKKARMLLGKSYHKQ